MEKVKFKRNSKPARPQYSGDILHEIVKDITAKEAAALFCSKHFRYPLEVDKIDRRGIFTVDGLSDRIVYRAFRDKTPEGRTRYRIARVYGVAPDILTSEKHTKITS